MYKFQTFINLTQFDINLWSEKQKEETFKIALEVKQHKPPFIHPQESFFDVEKKARKVIRTLQDLYNLEKSIIMVFGEYTFCYAITEEAAIRGAYIAVPTFEKKTYTDNTTKNKKEITSFAKYRIIEPKYYDYLREAFGKQIKI